MKKLPKQEVAIATAPAPAVTSPITIKPSPIGQSHTYRIEKYGMYAYQLVRLVGDQCIPVGESNIYPVVASDLTDRLLDEINEGNK